MEFIDDPIAYFGGSADAAHGLSGAELEQLQQAGLAHRLGELLPRLAPLAALAGAQGFDAGLALDEAPWLFLPHTIYKSFDPVWLAAHDFARMTRWLQCFTSVDLGEPLPTLATADAWLDWLEAERDFDVAHSTGTTGRLSLVGRARFDVRGRFERNRMDMQALLRAQGLSSEMDLHIVWPGAAGGRAAQQKLAEGWRTLGTASRDHFIALFDDDLGVDYELYVAGARLAREHGILDLPPPSPHVADRLAEAGRRQARYGEYVERMIDRMADRLPGKRVMMIGSPHTLAALAQAALARGLAGSFAPGSFHLSVGGLKGRPAPAGLEDALRRLLGSGFAAEGYGATELNTGYQMCAAGRFHVPPWVVVWALDPAGGWRPKPRRDVQEGRGAFLDLAFQSAWGGLVTADHLVIDYRPCACGRAGPSFARNVRRVADRDLDYSWIPASPRAFAAAMEVLRAG